MEMSFCAYFAFSKTPVKSISNRSFYESPTEIQLSFEWSMFLTTPKPEGGTSRKNRKRKRKLDRVEIFRCLATLNPLLDWKFPQLKPCYIEPTYGQTYAEISIFISMED